MNDEEWKKRLTPEQYKVLRKKSTELPFTGKLLHNKEKGIYMCAACGSPLFSSETKFDSGSGWPSFFDVISKGNIELKEDKSLFMRRTEVICKTCGGHLGHLFNDGPRTVRHADGTTIPATGQRYCINSVVLKFKKK